MVVLSNYMPIRLVNYVALIGTGTDKYIVAPPKKKQQHKSTSHA